MVDCDRQCLVVDSSVRFANETIVYGTTTWSRFAERVFGVGLERDATEDRI